MARFILFCCQNGGFVSLYIIRKREWNQMVVTDCKDDVEFIYK